MSTSDIILIIGVLTTSIVTIITALKVKAIEHSVNSSASAQTALLATKAATIDSKDAIIVALTKNLTDAQETAKLLAQNAGPVKRTRI